MKKAEQEQKRLLSDIEGSYTPVNNTDIDKGSLKDHGNFVFIMFFIQGVGLLLPWNTFITAHEYFKYKLKNDSHDDETFENAFSVSSQLPCTAALVVSLFLTGKISRSFRMILGLVVTALCFLTTDILVYVKTQTWTKSFFTLTLILVVVINICAGILQGTVFGMAGVAGPRYMQATILGMSIGGIIVALMSVVSLAAGDNIQKSALAYFTLSVLVIVTCIISYIALTKTKLMKFVLKKESDETNNDNISQSASLEKLQKYNGESNLSIGKQIWCIWKNIYTLACSVCLVFTVTIGLMPSVISNIVSVKKSNGSDWTNKYFPSLVCFLLFNCADFAGRLAGGYYQVVKAKGIGIPLLSILRIGFIPLFMFCNYQPREHMPVYFHSDSIPILLNFFMSISNGYLTSLCMMYGPQQVAEEYQEKAGVIMQLSLSVGLCFGAGLSYALVAII